MRWEEIFGPVLSIVRVDTCEEDLAITNASRYGNGMAISPNDGGGGRRFQNEVHIGMIGINLGFPQN